MHFRSLADESLKFLQVPWNFFDASKNCLETPTMLADQSMKLLEIPKIFSDLSRVFLKEFIGFSMIS